VNAIRIAEVVTDVDGALIDVHVGAGRAEEGRCTVERSIGCWYEGQQILRDGIRASLNCGAIGVAQDGREAVFKTLVVTQPFVTRKEEGVVAPDGGRQRSSAELVALESGLRLGARGIEESLRASIALFRR